MSACRRSDNRLLVFFVVIAFSLLLAKSFLSKGFRERFFLHADYRFRTSKVTCIEIIRNFDGKEGVGARIKRTQFAFFLASILRAEIDFPKLNSSHWYFTHELFSKCQKAEPACNLSEETAAIARCPRGDCDCLKDKVVPHVLPLARRCSVISVENVQERTMEYGGCLGQVVSRYFGMTHPPWESLDYDAIHIRAGDMANQTTGKAYHPNEIQVLLKQMCLLSNRDIVIVTEGAPEMPVIRECGDRLVLSGNNTLKEAFGIFQHAKQVSLGTSSFAGLLAEVVRPERMIVVERAAEVLEWVDCEKWTVLSKKYAVFHFDSKQMMLHAVIDRSLESRSYHTKTGQQAMTCDSAVPRRRWSNETSWILNRREQSRE